MNKLVITLLDGYVKKVTANYDTKDLEIIIEDNDIMGINDSTFIIKPDYDADEVEQIAASILY